jgi:hypothetical protein
MMKAARKRRSPGVPPPRRLAMKLPPQSPPVMRSVSHGPVGTRFAASDLSECLRCFAACRRRGGPFQQMCEDVCSAVCGI